VNAEEFIEQNVHTVFGLLLEPTGRVVGEYKRIGLAEIADGIAMG
jgi:hypothetical protein